MTRLSLSCSMLRARSSATSGLSEPSTSASAARTRQSRSGSMPGQHEREGLRIDRRCRPERRGAHGRPVVRQEILRDRQAVGGSHGRRAPSTPRAARSDASPGCDASAARTLAGSRRR